MRLLIISHTPHYLKDGTIVGWGPTVREIDSLSELFSHVIHLAPLHDDPAPLSAIPYQSNRVELQPVRPSGGKDFADKFGILTKAPRYVGKILRELHKADVVHVRCPSNISLIAVILLAMAKNPSLRWVKYAGNWRPIEKESWSYSFQRWWLSRGICRAIVTVNGDWPNQPEHVHSFLNPCLTDQELADSKRTGAGKVLSGKVRICYVGRLEEVKGVGRILSITKYLADRGMELSVDLVGDGPERSKFERTVRDQKLKFVTFHGWLPRSDLTSIYSTSHFMLMPSSGSEGWPKVLSEAMACGVIPISSNISSIPQYLKKFGCGRALDPKNLDGFVSTIQEYCSEPTIWKIESEKGMEAASLFSYSAYLRRVESLLKLKSGPTLNSAQEGSVVRS